MAAGQPVISVDAKKELVGDFARAGRRLARKGAPGPGPLVPGPGDRARDSLRDLRRRRERGLRQRRVGRERREPGGGVGPPRWLALAGRDAYPRATRLLVTCDAGGGNGWRNRGWKKRLARSLFS